MFDGIDMRAYLKRFRAYRELESQVESLRGEKAIQAIGIVSLTGDKEALQSQIDNLQHELEIERAKRISAEAIAVERQRSIDRMDSEVKRANESRDTVFSDRLHSLDAVNAAFIQKITPEREPTKEEVKELSAKVAEVLPHAKQKIIARAEQRAGAELAAIRKKHADAKSKEHTVDSVAN
jgi:NADH dehydrogenase/NADH:ubiquinone oxidoreductase subunit G